MTKVKGLLLAAGCARRFGSNKLLASVANEPVLTHSLNQLKAALGEDVLVVLGYQAEALIPLLGNTSYVVNSDYPLGMGSSISTGIKTLVEQDGDAVLVALADQVAVTSDDYRTLLNRYRAYGGPACALYQQHLGVPAIFPRELFPHLESLKGDQGARGWLPQLAGLQTVAMPNAALDIDTPADLDRYNLKLAGS